MSELLSDKDIKSELGELNDWSYDGVKISKEIRFKTYMDSIDMINLIAEEAERVNHHPDLKFGWGYATIIISTHAINGLAESDFVLAAKIDEINV